MAAAIHVPVIPPRFDLARPSASDSISFQIFAKFPPENPATAYLAVEDSDELNERRSSTLKTRPADWLGKFGAVSLFDDGTVQVLPRERWLAVATDSVLVQTYITQRQSSAARTALQDRLRTNLALPLSVGGARTSNERLISILMVDGRVTKSSSLPGMGQTQTARGECYVQVHRTSDGRAVGPLLHLVGAADTGFNLSGAWLIDGKWLLWYEDDLEAVWAIRFDWDVESAKLDAAPVTPALTPK